MKEFSILALGGNVPSSVGGPNSTLDFALKSLEKYEVNILKESLRYVTPAFPSGSGPDFVNSIALCDSEHKPGDLLNILHKVEADCGRVRDQRWGARTLDIDLIASGSTILPNREVYLEWNALEAEKQTEIAPQELILPHPRLQDRVFVLVPLFELLPDWVHPVLGLTVSEMLQKLPESDRNAVVRLPEG